MTAFHFEIYDSGMTKLNEFQPDQARWDCNVKDPSGSLSFTTPMGATPSGLAVGTADIVIIQDGWPVWRGQVLGRQVTVDGPRVQQQWSAVGLFELLADRYIPAGAVYTNYSMSIAATIIDDIWAQSNGALINGGIANTDFTSDPADYPDALITKRYDTTTSAKSAIEELLGIYPAEFFYHPMKDGRLGLTYTSPSAAPILVIAPTDLTTDTNTPLAVGAEISSMQATANYAPGGPFCNYAVAYGAGGVPSIKSDTTYMASMRRRDKVTVSSEDDTANTLNGRAAAILWDGQPRTIPTVTVRQGVNIVELGDSTILNAPALPEANGKYRVTGRTVQWKLGVGNSFTQDLTMETWSPRTVTPFV